MDDPYSVFLLWPLFLASGWAIFVLSFIIPEPAGVMALRVLSFILLITAAVSAIPGIT